MAPPSRAVWSSAAMARALVSVRFCIHRRTRTDTSLSACWASRLGTRSSKLQQRAPSIDTFSKARMARRACICSSAVRAPARDSQSLFTDSVVVLETPHTSPAQTDYLCQIVISWPEAKGLAIPASNEDRVAVMKQLAADWAEPFRSLVQNIPPDAQVTSINVEDWLPSNSNCNARGHGRMVLMGDAAHTMTMCEYLHKSSFFSAEMLTFLQYSPRRRRQPSHSRRALLHATSRASADTSQRRIIYRPARPHR